MAIPMQIISVDEGGAAALCVGRGGEARVDTMLVGPLQPGQWVLTFLGAAREVVCAEEAARINAALGALDDVMAGRSVDLEAAFADLINREPQLPAHLRPPPADPDERNTP